jgi:hypothetical protein
MMKHRKIILLYIIYARLRFVPIIRYESLKHNTLYKVCIIFIYCN